MYHYGQEQKLEPNSHVTQPTLYILSSSKNFTSRRVELSNERISPRTRQHWTQQSCELIYLLPFFYFFHSPFLLCFALSSQSCGFHSHASYNKPPTKEKLLSKKVLFFLFKWITAPHFLKNPLNSLVFSNDTTLRYCMMYCLTRRLWWAEVEK